MGYSQSPLRYPGGKSAFSKFLAEFIHLNSLQEGIYAEPYAGGAGAGLNLLFGEYVERLILNDADKRIYLFWQSILHQTEEFTRLVNDATPSISEWQRKKTVLMNVKDHSPLDVAFATFYMNRCNRSGILNAGPIGGQSQRGKWRIDARFNRKELVRRIEKIALYSSRISVYNLDAIEFIKRCILPATTENNRVLVYLDPPYYAKGDQLYLDYYTPQDHKELAQFINSQTQFKWIVSYDDVPQIRELYPGRQIRLFSHYYCHTRKTGSEVVIYCPNCILPLPASNHDSAINK